jgi:hypothetical protein
LRAAQKLAESGTESGTLQRHLVRGEQPDGGQKRLYVLDESSLASTKQMNELLHRLEGGDRVLLVGDKRQHEAAEAGRPYRQLQEAGMPEKAFASGFSLRQVFDEEKVPGDVAIRRLSPFFVALAAPFNRPRLESQGPCLRPSRCVTPSGVTPLGVPISFRTCGSDVEVFVSSCSISSSKNPPEERQLHYRVCSRT